MSGSRFVARLPSLSRKLLINPNIKSTKAVKSTTSPSHSFASPNPISAVSRRLIPVELSCLMSMMPLHSAIASSRMISFLAVDSQSWGLIPQGISMPL